MNSVISSDISYIAVFLQGLFSFFSPCVLPLLPVYLGYLSGGTGDRMADGTLRFEQGKILRNTICFVIGISAAFFMLGMGASVAGSFLVGQQHVITRVGGGIMILFGLYQLGLLGRWEFLAKERRLPFSPGTMAASPFMALLLGFVFSFAWTPCVGPMLGSVLILAAAEPGKGMVMIMFYTLGFVIPFILLGLFSGTVLGLLKRHSNIMKYTVKAGGVLMILLGLLLCSGQLQAGGEAASRNPAGETDAAQNAQRAAETNHKVAAVSFELKDQYGKTHTLSEYKGKVIFLNFWATWCPPCRAEMPDIQKLYERSPKEGEGAVIVLGVASPKLGNEKDEAGIKAFMDKNGYTYPVLMDARGELFSAYGIRAIPTTFMIDREGNVYGRVQGALSGENIDKVVKQTLESK
ncbi:MAG: redoxin domain-containing protein [Acidaminococcaceae bacterium]|nr:redoxin domain-containing protein [Acidaminococcaceae bacterium]MBO6266019.1 redoxin domain-containing protein [Acidaminococcaceae bacterium]